MPATLYTQQQHSDSSLQPIPIGNSGRAKCIAETADLGLSLNLLEDSFVLPTIPVSAAVRSSGCETAAVPPDAASLRNEEWAHSLVILARIVKLDGLLFQLTCAVIALDRNFAKYG